MNGFLIIEYIVKFRDVLERKGMDYQKASITKK
jgi:hypothetical protein